MTVKIVSAPKVNYILLLANIGFWHGKASQNKILRPEGEEFFLLAHKLEKKLSPQAK